MLAAQLQYRDQKIIEMQKFNEKLRATNATLTSKNKQLLARAATETKLQKVIGEKERELTELMDEGKRLSDHSGKQAREIRKLKQQVAQLDVLTGARDATMHELQTLQKEHLEQRKEMDELKGWSIEFVTF